MSQLAQIRVEKILYKVMRRQPSALLVRFFKWLLVEDWVNWIIQQIGPAKNEEFMIEAVRQMKMKVTVRGLENLPPDSQRNMFVCNHPLGGMDVLSAVSVVSPHYKQGIMIPANDVLMLLTPIQEMLIPVNKMGGQHKSLLEVINNAYASDKQLMFFPAGKVSRKHGKHILDDDWKKNFVSKSIEYHRNIVPIRIEAKNSNFFYRLAKFRNWLGVKFNIEMLFLIRETKKQQGKSVTIHIGKTIPWTSLNESKTAYEWAQEIRKQVYEL